MAADGNDTDKPAGVEATPKNVDKELQECCEVPR